MELEKLHGKVKELESEVAQAHQCIAKLETDGGSDEEEPEAEEVEDEATEVKVCSSMFINPTQLQSQTHWSSSMTHSALPALTLAVASGPQPAAPITSPLPTHAIPASTSVPSVGTPTTMPDALNLVMPTPTL
jgi:hypothetical protein